MGKLDNLVSDIGRIFKEGKQPSEKDLKQFTDDVSSVIRKSFETRDVAPEEAIRFSSIGKPDRMLWYINNKPEIAEELHLSTRIKFMYGDLIEQLLVLLIKTAGYEVTDQQKEINIELKDIPMVELMVLLLIINLPLHIHSINFLMALFLQTIHLAMLLSYQDMQMEKMKRLGS
jgi:hypothetical protein